VFHVFMLVCPALPTCLLPVCPAVPRSYVVTGMLGVSMSYHRQLSHKSFRTPKVRTAAAAAASGQDTRARHSSSSSRSSSRSRDRASCRQQTVFSRLLKCSRPSAVPAQYLTGSATAGHPATPAPSAYARLSQVWRLLPSRLPVARAAAALLFSLPLLHAA
jgi:hypothetical protein